MHPRISRRPAQPKKLTITYRSFRFHELVRPTSKMVMNERGLILLVKTEAQTDLTAVGEPMAANIGPKQTSAIPQQRKQTESMLPSTSIGNSAAQVVSFNQGDSLVLASPCASRIL